MDSWFSAEQLTKGARFGDMDGSVQSNASQTSAAVAHLVRHDCAAVLSVLLRLPAPADCKGCAESMGVLYGFFG